MFEKAIMTDINTVDQITSEVDLFGPIILANGVSNLFLIVNLRRSLACNKVRQ